MDKISSAHLIGPLKSFVKASEERQADKTQPTPIPRPAYVSGSSVKQFYERVVGKEAFEVNTTSREKKETTPRNCKRTRLTNENTFDINTLMKAIETSSVNDVERIMHGYEDKINSTDQFGWTPIMSACCVGDASMVKLLLKWNPNLNVTDKKGNTCRTLATAKGHCHVLTILDEYTQEKINYCRTAAESSNCSQKLVITPFYCKTCKQSFENTSLKQHLSSTVHNFNAASKKKMPTMYGIPESNKGFQILLKSGWDKETGLGPSGEGHKFPPKTILKQDRTGLGAKSYKPRVTHSVEDARREAKPKDTFKRRLQSQKRKEQRLERNLRQMLS